MTHLVFPRTTRIPVPGRSLWWLGGAILAGVLLPVLVGALTGIVAYYPVASFLPRFSIMGWAGTIFLILGLSGLIAVVGIGYSLAAWSWRPAFLSFVLAAAMIFCVLSGLGLSAHGLLRQQAFHALSDRSRVLIAAIEAYTRTNGAPPRTLDDLVPAFLLAVPGTGMSVYPRYDYTVGGTYCGDAAPWSLFVLAGNFLNWDTFFYCPGQNYPADVGGNWVERMGDWAYMHE